MSEKSRNRRRKKRKKLIKLKSFCNLIITISTIFGLLVNSVEGTGYTKKTSMIMYGISIGLLLISALVRYQLEVKEKTLVSKVKEFIEHFVKNKFGVLISTFIFSSIYILVFLIIGCLLNAKSDVMINIGIVILVAFIAISFFILFSIDIIGFENGFSVCVSLVFLFFIAVIILSYSSHWWINLVLIYGAFLLVYGLYVLKHNSKNE